MEFSSVTLVTTFLLYLWGYLFVASFQFHTSGDVWSKYSHQIRRTHNYVYTVKKPLYARNMFLYLKSRPILIAWNVLIQFGREDRYRYHRIGYQSSLFFANSCLFILKGLVPQGGFWSAFLKNQIDALRDVYQRLSIVKCQTILWLHLTFSRW